MLTTSKAEEDIVRTYDLGVNSFITKPVTFLGLVEVMKVFSRYWMEIVDLPARGRTAGVSPRTLSVLVVDDDEDDILIARDLLREIDATGYVVDRGQ